MADPLKVVLYCGKGTNPQQLETHLVESGFNVILDPTGETMASADRAGADVLYLPGGWYQLSDKIADGIRGFVRDGGGCVSTCAGSFLTVGSLGLIAGQTLRSNFRGRLYLEPRIGDHPILAGVVQRCTRHSNRVWEPIAVTHLGGPMMIADDPECYVATYDAEQTIGALLAAQYQSGRVVAIASHPELPLADLPTADNADRTSPLPQGDARLIVTNAIRWVAAARTHCPDDSPTNRKSL